MPSLTVFICYRRDDSAGYAGRLCDRLVKALGRDRVFRDADGLQPGDNFLQSIRERVSAADVLFVLIGPRWLAATDREGYRRLDDPHDLVRLEIELGLERKKTSDSDHSPRSRDAHRRTCRRPWRRWLSARQSRCGRCTSTTTCVTSSQESDRSGRSNLRRLVRENSATVLALAILVASGFVASLFWMRPAFLMTAERARSQLALAGLSYDGEGSSHVC
jgi:hypothetical protein